MDVLSLFNGKGGVGKSTLTPILAASIKTIFPDLTVGVIAADSANGTLSKMYSKDLEATDQGLWNIINTMISRRTKGNTDLLAQAIKNAVRPLTIIPGESNVPHRQEDFLAAARDLGVSPNTPLRNRQIEFIGTAQFLGPETRNDGLSPRPGSQRTRRHPHSQALVYTRPSLRSFALASVGYHRHLGMGFSGPRDREFVMRANSIDYLAPARFDDLVEVFIRVSRIGRTSVTYECAAYRLPDDTLMVTAQQTLVLISVDSRQPTPVPADLRSAVRSFELDDLDA